MIVLYLHGSAQLNPALYVCQWICLIPSPLAYLEKFRQGRKELKIFSIPLWLTGFRSIAEAPADDPHPVHSQTQTGQSGNCALHRASLAQPHL